MKHQTIKQHIELGTSRQLRDAVDLNPLSANFTMVKHTQRTRSQNADKLFERV